MPRKSHSKERMILDYIRTEPLTKVDLMMALVTDTYRDRRSEQRVQSKSEERVERTKAARRAKTEEPAAPPASSQAPANPGYRPRRTRIGGAPVPPVGEPGIGEPAEA